MLKQVPAFLYCFPNFPNFLTRNEVPPQLIRFGASRIPSFTMPSAVPVDATFMTNGTSTKVQTVPVGVWGLDSTGASGADPPANTEALISVRKSPAESVIGRDDRVLVDKVNFKQGGKYRGKSLSTYRRF